MKKKDDNKFAIGTLVSGIVGFGVGALAAYFYNTGEAIVNPTPSQPGSTPVEVHKDLADHAFKEGNYAKAVEHYSQALALDKSNFILYCNRSLAYSKLQNWEDAYVDACICVQLQPQFSKGYLRQGIALRGLGKLAEAKAAFGEGLKIEPNNTLLAQLYETTTAVEQQETKTPAETAATTPPPMTKSTTQPASSECVVCLDAIANHACIPCGHLSLCGECSQHIKSCPMCRSPVEKVVKIFF